MFLSLLRVELSRLCAVLTLGVGVSCSSGPDGGLLSDPVTPFLEETTEVPMWVGSSSSLSGLSTVDLFPVFPRVVMAPSHGFRLCRSGRWLLLAPRSWWPPSRSPRFSLRHVLAFCAMRVGIPPCSLALCRAPWLVAWRPCRLPHYRWSRVHGRSQLVSSDESQLCEWPFRGSTAPVSWLRGGVPLLRPIALLFVLGSSVPSGSLLRYRFESSQ